MYEKNVFEHCQCRMLGCIGEGAFSKVYHLMLLEEGGERKELACKVSERTELLEKEAEFLKHAHHPMFPHLFHFCRGEKESCLFMEYIPGITLEQYLRRAEEISLEELYQTAESLAEGIRYMHQLGKGYLYRDLKPENIIVTAPGSCKLVDFGCVCHKGSRGDIAGTPGYGAPEQLQGGSRLDESCDVYGFGRVLETMACRAKSDVRIRKLIKACCNENAGRRPPDMEWVFIFLRAGQLSGFQKDVLEGKVCFKQNISANSVKNY